MIPDNLKHLDAGTIASRHTIQLTPRQALIDSVAACATERGVAAEELADLLIQNALNQFNRIIETRSPAKVITEWAAKAQAYAGADAPWSYACQRRHINKVRLTAGEFEVSTAAFATLLLAEGLERSLSTGNLPHRALSAGESVPSPQGAALD